MTKNKILDIPFMDKKNYVMQTCLMYKKLKDTRENYEEKEFEKDFNLKKYDPISLFEKIIKMLSTDEELIIRKEFLERNGSSNWYLDYWSKSSYYKYKHEAINKFLMLFFS